MTNQKCTPAYEAAIAIAEAANYFHPDVANVILNDIRELRRFYIYAVDRLVVNSPNYTRDMNLLKSWVNVIVEHIPGEEVE